MALHDLMHWFAIDKMLTITEGKGGLVMMEITTQHATAVISTYGGQVLSYCPTGQNDLLFQGESACYANGKAIRSGVPICWPWFGLAPKGNHGFARNRQWELQTTEAQADGSVRVCLGLCDSEETRAIWPHKFRLGLEITVGAKLEISLTTRNLDSESFPLSQALHTYFNIGHISRIQVLGLEGCPYVDLKDGNGRKHQNGPVTIQAETDRVYTGVTFPLEIRDGAWERRIRIDSSGSSSAVVWNPWEATAKAMEDLGDDDYQRMICVETTNTGPDTIILPPGAEHRLTACYSVV